MRWLRSPLGITIALAIIAASAFVGWKAVQSTVRVKEAVAAGQMARIRSEQEALREALESFRNRYGTEPPANNDPLALQRQFRKMFPRYAGDAAEDLAAAGLNVENLDAAEMLVFSLGGMRESPGSKTLLGFSPNPEAPLDRSHPGRPLFAFDVQRLVDADGDGWLEYQTSPPGDQRGFFRFDSDPVGGRIRIVVAGLQIDGDATSP
ncbi:MAG TPA: hypothetical protein VHC19_27440 [Pirellulales bacterium]|nr:hypothetical protein [Pirellulales bacterium]